MTLQAHEARRFDRTGLLAIDPKAFLELFIAPQKETENVTIGDAVIVDVQGPLCHRGGYWSDSYESLASRIDSACAAGAKAIVLRIDSPGGEAQGCFEVAREIRAKCLAASVPLYAFVEGRACSAAYAIASAAQWISLAESATAGSIGVLSTRTDYSAQNAAAGVRVEFITSGARKADGHPDTAITEAELAAEQAIVDSLAGVFFALVSEHRGLSVPAVKQLEAGVFHGAAAVAAGLAEEVSTFKSLLARIAAGGMERSTMTIAKAKADLEAMAKGKDAKVAKQAQAALAAMAAAEGGEEEKPPKKEDEDEETSATDPAPPADAAAADEDEEEKRKKKEKEDAAAAEAGAAAAAGGGNITAAMAWAKVHELEAKLAQRDERDERTKLVASRPDFGPELLSVLKDAPIEMVRNMVKTLPKGKPHASNKAAAAAQSNVQPTLGADQTNEQGPRLAPELKAKMDRAMGLASGAAAPVNDPYRMTLSGVPAQKGVS